MIAFSLNFHKYGLRGAHLVIYQLVNIIRKILSFGYWNFISIGIMTKAIDSAAG